MTQQVINVGSVPNDGTGDPIRTAYIKCNNNFSELYSRVQTDPPLSLVGSPGDVAGMTAYDENFFYYCFADYDGSSVIWRALSNSTPIELANGSSNIVIAANSTVSISVAGVSNVASFTPTTFNVNNIDAAGTIAADGNLTVGGSLNLAGDLISGGNLTVNDTIQAQDLILTGTVQVAGNVQTHSIIPAANVAYDLGSPTAQFRDLYLSGNTLYIGGGTLTANATSMTLSTATGAEFVIGGASGNATGAFGNLDVTNDANVGGNIAASYFIGDGSFLTNITAFSNVAATIIANGTSSISIPVINGNAVLQSGGVQTLNVAPTGIAVTGNINSTGSITGGAITSGAISATGTIAATGNISGANLNTTGSVIATGAISATGNITGGNLSTAGALTTGSVSTGSITATGNIAGGNLSTAGTISAIGNIAGGNISTAGAIAATGNLTAAGISATGPIVTGSATAATSTTTGSIRTSGGMGVAGNIYVGGLVDITGNISAGNIFSSNRANVAFLDVVSGIDVKASAESVSITTGSIKTAGGVGIAGNVYVGQAIVASGTITGGNIIGGNITSGNITTSGNIDIGGTIIGNTLNLTTATVSGNVDAGNFVTTGIVSSLSVSTSGIAKTGANGAGNIGSSTNYFNTVFAKATSAQYADLAECYLSDSAYEPGTVLKFGGDKEVTIADLDHDPEIAGVVSTNPAYIMNASLIGQHSVTVALAGRVPCRVRGPVRRGQMMVSAGDGYARAEKSPAMGTVIGKALADFDGDQGVIEIVVGRL